MQHSRRMHNRSVAAIVAALASYAATWIVSAQNAPLPVLTEPIPGTDITFKLVQLPGGAVILGSPEHEIGRRRDEGPQVMVEVPPFYIGVSEVTYDEYVIFRYEARDGHGAAEGVNFDPSVVARPSPPYEDPAHGHGNQGFPAVGMTQWGALQYTKWLSDKTGEFYRLPTEAEWEYACRAGTTTAYSFGDDAGALDMYAWYIGNSGEEFKRPGSKAPNPWGLFDMHGNVAEWTLDHYDAEAYTYLGGENIWVKPTRLHPRTVRGGAFDDTAEDLRCAARLESSLHWKRRDPQIPKSLWWNTDSPFVGFRIARPVGRPSPEEEQAFWDTVLGG